MKLQIIQLEPYDDVISVRDRLAFVNTERVLLVWPRNPTPAHIFRRKLDLVLIQREASRRGARLALVTHDADVIEFADELNISTFHSVQASHRARWKRPLNKVFIDRSDRPENAPDAYELRETESRLRRLTPEQRRTQRNVRAVAAGILALVLIGVGVLFVPSAEITISPAQGQINTTVTLVADPSTVTVNVETGRIPAALLSIDVTTQASIPTTGSADVANTLASGTVIFTNNGDQPVLIPAGTIVSTFGFQPAHFHTTADANLDGGADHTVQVTIEAEQDTAGAIGNIEANLITNVAGPLATTLSVRNADATRGGTVRQQGIVTRTDTDNLLILAREKIRQTALGEFNLSTSQVIVPDSIKITEERKEWTTYSAFVGDATDTLTLSMRATVQALVIDTQLAHQAALASLATQIQSGREIVPESVAFKPFKPSDVISSDPNGQVTFVMSASANIAYIIDPDQVRRAISGASVGDAANILEHDWVLDVNRPPVIKVWPELFRRLPILGVRIAVAVQE
jgi:Baseplate J-like protein